MQKITMGWLFGFCLMFMLGAITIAIAFGHIEEKTSFGLQWVVAALVLIAKDWASWKFSREEKDSEEQK